MSGISLQIILAIIFALLGIGLIRTGINGVMVKKKWNRYLVIAVGFLFIAFMIFMIIRSFLLNV
ncbi:hypothetical protein [Luteirhabdus pelagi]|jgi:large-conductance mechanosensitive channel|uniref:hypothetical protein n=1 Tax=Luteirhabdus pelagi TaxID=2792783 RepID=UPI00193992F7|nr:hypothetical protein [Luteirhabdus pelagi]